MRRFRLLLASALVALLAPPAVAATAEEVGWWWRAQTGLLVEVPPPPTTPEGGLVVAAGPDGATAVAAVRFSLSGGEEPTALRLDVADVLGVPAVLACPSALRWMPAEAGRWESRPTVACDRAQSTGVPDDDGSSWSFDVTGFAAGQVLDVVLLPDVPTGEVRPDAFQVAFAPPADDAVTASQPDPATAPTEQPTTEPTPLRPAAPPPPGGFVPRPPPPRAAVGPDDPAEPTVAPPSTAPEDRQTDPPGDPTAAARTEEVDPGEAAVAATALLLVTVALLWLFGPRHAVATEAGLARWRRPREGAPPPLL